MATVIDAVRGRPKGGGIYSRATRGSTAHSHDHKGQDRSALFDRVQCNDLQAVDQLSTAVGADVLLHTGVASTADATNAGISNGQILSPQMIRIPFGPATPNVADDDIIVANGGAATPTVVLPADITVIDFWVDLTALEGGALLAQLSTAAAGAGLVGPTLDLNVALGKRGGSGVPLAQALTPASNLFIHFNANPTTAAGTFYIMYYVN